jgi:hypothetical protein
MPTKTQRGWGHWRKATVDEDVLRGVTYVVKPCVFSEVLKRAKQALAQGNGTHTRIPNWMSPDYDFDHEIKSRP